LSSLLLNRGDFFSQLFSAALKPMRAIVGAASQTSTVEMHKIADLAIDDNAGVLSFYD
jgi:hypothetical protein